jgi:uncharacterized protein YjbJ (UPF0337 family)
MNFGARESEPHVHCKERHMGAAPRAKESVKEVAGKVTSDVELEADGKVDNVVGKV